MAEGRHTLNARNEIEREKNYSATETRKLLVNFVGDKDNFLTVHDGIVRELERLGHNGDDKALWRAFKQLLTDKGFVTENSEFRVEKRWFADKAVPNRESAIKLCFALGLDESRALDFLWKACKLNGFNFRRAKDVVCCYCLANGLEYGNVARIMDVYDTYPAAAKTGDEPRSDTTRRLRGVFGKLEGMSEADFLDKLKENKGDFINYSKSAGEEFTRLIGEIRLKVGEMGYSGMTGADIDENKKRRSKDGGYVSFEDIGDALVFWPSDTQDEIDDGKASVEAVDAKIKKTFAGFINAKSLYAKFEDPTKLTESEQGSARRAFVFLYFANYVLKWSKLNTKDHFSNFYIGLTELLDKCGYGFIYYADPFDFLILSCVNALKDAEDKNEQAAGQASLLLYNEVAAMLAGVDMYADGEAE